MTRLPAPCEEEHKSQEELLWWIYSHVHVFENSPYLFHGPFSFHLRYTY